jgi:hypothetical protein
MPLLGGQSLHPRSNIPSREAAFYEASTRVQAIRPSGRPLACGHPDGTGRPRAFPRAPHPADQEPTTHARVGTGHRARTWNYALNITSVDPPIGSSLTTCDLASHAIKRNSAPGGLWARPNRRHRACADCNDQVVRSARVARPGRAGATSSRCRSGGHECRRQLRGSFWSERSDAGGP